MDEKRAREILAEYITEEGGLASISLYMGWTPGEDTACLDDNFTADQLEAIAWWMRHSRDAAEGSEKK